MDLPNLNQVKLSETSARQFEWFAQFARYLTVLGTFEAK